MKWFRFYFEAKDDTKVQSLRPELFKFWVNLLCLAGEIEQNGRLPDSEAIAFALRVRIDRVNKYLEELQAAGLVDKAVPQACDKSVTSLSQACVIHNWESRQRHSDDAAGRKRDYREKTYINGHAPNVPGHVPAMSRPQIKSKNKSKKNNEPNGSSSARDSLFEPGEIEPKPEPTIDGLAETVALAQELFGERQAEVVKTKGKDIARNVRGPHATTTALRFACYRDGLRDLHRRQSKAGSGKIDRPHSYVMSRAQEYATDGLPIAIAGTPKPKEISPWDQPAPKLDLGPLPDLGDFDPRIYINPNVRVRRRA